jgi:geranylgeranyl diphosphate synthase type II
MTTFQENFEKIRNLYLESMPDSTLKTAIEYALLGTGKLLRPQLMLSLIEAKGMDASLYYQEALALECIHTYSLVHDDLPAMDDDSMRRGKPTVHIAFDEATAILVGDALLSDAFRLITENPQTSSDQKVQLTKTLSNAIGSSGMVLGQTLDIASEGQKVTLQELERMNELKTGKLLEASIVFGAIISGQTPLAPYQKLAYQLGLLYQLQDDLLETLEDEKKLGKSKSDGVRQKPTTVSLLGIEAAQEMIESYHLKIAQSLSELNLQNTPFSKLISVILNRSY